jgi:hypothetical protein
VLLLAWEVTMKPDVSDPQPSTPTPSLPRGAPATETGAEFLARIDRILTGEEPPPLMKTPPDVQVWVDREAARLAQWMTPESLQRMTDNLNLQYHYGGQEVLTWQTPQGVAVLAVGMEQVARVVNHLSPELRLTVWSRVPPLWA